MGADRVSIDIHINGAPFRLRVKTSALLLDVLREDLGLKGTKRGCDQGQCGACTVLLDGRPVLSCNLLAVQADGKKVTTIEGMAPEGKLHPLQDCFYRRRRGAVRLLHTGDDSFRQGPFRSKSRSGG